jgi:hypothetical protein
MNPIFHAFEPHINLPFRQPSPLLNSMECTPIGTMGDDKALLTYIRRDYLQPGIFLIIIRLLGIIQIVYFFALTAYLSEA